LAPIQAEWWPRETVAPTQASVCSRWSTIFASSEGERQRPTVITTYERNPRPHLQNRKAREPPRRRQLLSEARGAEALVQEEPPKRVGGEEPPGVAAVRERELRASESVASPPVSAARTQAGLMCGLSPSRHLLGQAGRRLAHGQRHDRCHALRTQIDL